MSTVRPPIRLGERHRLIGYMMIAGETNGTIAKKLGLSENWISTVKTSPLFQVLLSDLRRELKDKTVGEVVDMIVAEGPASIRTLVELRDGAENESVRQRSASDLLDRNPHASRIHKNDEAPTVRIALDVSAVHLMAQAMAEDDGRVAPAIPAVATTIPGNGAVRARTIDEAITAYEEAAGSPP